MRRQIVLAGGDEFSAFTRWRKMTGWKPGRLRKIKRKHNKRVRRLAKIQALIV